MPKKARTKQRLWASVKWVGNEEWRAKQIARRHRRKTILDCLIVGWKELNFAWVHNNLFLDEEFERWQNALTKAVELNSREDFFLRLSKMLSSCDFNPKSLLPVHHFGRLRYHPTDDYDIRNLPATQINRSHSPIPNNAKITSLFLCLESNASSIHTHLDTHFYCSPKRHPIKA